MSVSVTKARENLYELTDKVIKNIEECLNEEEIDW